MTNLPPDVILSAAKDLACRAIRVSRPQILRCAQDDRREGLVHSMQRLLGQVVFAYYCVYCPSFSRPVVGLEVRNARTGLGRTDKACSSGGRGDETCDIALSTCW